MKKTLLIFLFIFIIPMIIFCFGIGLIYIFNIFNINIDLNADIFAGGMATLCVLIPLILFLYFFKRNSTKCPKCNKPFALEKVNENKIDELTSTKTKKVLKPILDKYGKETGQFFETTENELETYDVYNVIYKCKYCGHIVEHKKEKIRWK